MTQTEKLREIVEYALSLARQHNTNWDFAIATDKLISANTAYAANAAYAAYAAAYAADALKKKILEYGIKLLKESPNAKP